MILNIYFYLCEMGEKHFPWNLYFYNLYMCIYIDYIEITFKVQ